MGARVCVRLRQVKQQKAESEDLCRHLLKLLPVASQHSHRREFKNLVTAHLGGSTEMRTSAGRAAAENWLMEAVKFYFALKIVALASFFCPLSRVRGGEGTVPSM